jgi:nucleotide-binding universal stress UspA family protein
MRKEGVAATDSNISPVLGGARRQLHDRVLVAYDGSDNAKRALSRAVEIAKRSKGDLRILVVADTDVYLAGSAGVLRNQIRRSLRESAYGRLSEALALAKEARLAAHGSIAEGDPADEILAVASQRKEDLIVIGRRGQSGLTRFLMGSVSSKIINNAGCDVLVVK